MRVEERKQGLSKLVTKARQTELSAIHKQLDAVEEWLKQKKKHFLSLVNGDQEDMVMSLSKKGKSKDTSTQEINLNDVLLQTKVEQIVDEIHVQIHNLLNHRARSAVTFL